MSLPDTSRRSILRAGGLALSMIVASVLGGCGFQPLYGDSSPTSTVAAELSAISIEPASTRIGQQVRNNLISTMSPPGQESASRYRLELDPIASLRDIFVQPDSDITRQNYSLKVRFALYDSGTNRLVHNGSAFSIVSYDRVESEFANVRALRAAEIQAARVVSDDIRTALAAFLSVN
jgi:LPS-assembly lipoprotein